MQNSYFEAFCRNLVSKIFGLCSMCSTKSLESYEDIIKLMTLVTKELVVCMFTMVFIYITLGMIMVYMNTLVAQMNIRLFAICKYSYYIWE